MSKQDVVSAVVDTQIYKNNVGMAIEIHLNLEIILANILIVE